MQFAMMSIGLALMSALAGCERTNAVPVVTEPDAVQLCDLPFPSVGEAAFLAMSESDQEDLLLYQGSWLNECLEPGSDTPPSLY